MTRLEPIDYARPDTPDAARVVIRPLPAGVSVSIGEPDPRALWREAILPVTFLIGLGGGMLATAGEFWATATPSPTRVLFAAGLVLEALLAAYGVADAVLNGGVVTEIGVANGSLHWTKVTLWRTTHARWPAASVRCVSVFPKRAVGRGGLHITFRRRIRAAAFTRQDSAALHHAAAALNEQLRVARGEPALSST